MSGLSVAKLKRLHAIRPGSPTPLGAMLKYDLLIDAIAFQTGIAASSLRSDRSLAFQAFKQCYGGSPILADIFGIPDLFYIPETPWRPTIPIAIRMFVYERDGFTCVACGVTDQLSLDHIMPYSRGGPDTMENLRCLCRRCNSRKNARTPEECGF